MVGLKIQNLDVINSLFICPYCSLLLQDPVQITDCGHRLCQSCANEQQGDTIICSACHGTTSRENLKPDRGFRNDMQTLSINCSLCAWTGVLRNYQDHLDQMHPNPVCEYCSQKFTSVNNLNQHQQFACDRRTIYCPLKSIGCEEMFLRINLSKHYLTYQHQTSIANFVRRLKPTSSTSTNNHLKIDVSQTTNITTDQLQEINERINILSDGVERLTDDIQRLGIECDQHQNTLHPFTQETAIPTKSIEEQKVFIDGVKLYQEILEPEVSSMKQKVHNIVSAASDGTFIWPITNVQEKLAAAQSETQTTIYSAPFYSSPTGYKMCLLLYLYGEGNARKTHMSLFFILMRGEYDAILPFPFCFKVIFCLYDQTEQQRHIIDVFRPDVRSKNFQRPNSDMNIASGISKFIPLKIIQQENSPYVQDDTMFIKVMIDFDNIPKAILPYVLNLNPALTTQMQQTMIREEVEKDSNNKYLTLRQRIMRQINP